VYKPHFLKDGFFQIVPWRPDWVEFVYKSKPYEIYCRITNPGDGPQLQKLKVVFKPSLLNLLDFRGSLLRGKSINFEESDIDFSIPTTYMGHFDTEYLELIPKDKSVIGSLWIPVSVPGLVHIMHGPLSEHLSARAFINMPKANNLIQDFVWGNKVNLHFDFGFGAFKGMLTYGPESNPVEGTKAMTEPHQKKGEDRKMWEQITY
jgi:hypothetical protein